MWFGFLSVPTRSPWVLIWLWQHIQLEALSQFSSQRAPVESERETACNQLLGLVCGIPCGCRITMCMHDSIHLMCRVHVHVHVHYNTMIRKQAVNMCTCHNKYASTLRHFVVSDFFSFVKTFIFNLVHLSCVA